MEALQPRI